MKILLFLFLLVLIPVTVTITAYGTHQSFETQCSISIDAELVPIAYGGEARNNPDGTVYPGDGFHYLFLFQGSDTCQSFSAQQLESEGSIKVLTHYSIIGPNSFTIQKNDHSHNDFNMELKYLLTKHYYIDKLHYCQSDDEDCESIVLAENPSYSVREDQSPSTSLQRILDGLSTASTYSVRIEETYSWGFGMIGVDHTHDANPHKYEDEESIEQFENYIENMCSNLEENQGCVFGHVEIDVEINPELCLYTELEKQGISTSEQPDDVCIIQNDNLQLDVKGTKIVCSYDDRGIKVCESVVVTSSRDVQPNILPADFEILFEKPALKDRDSYDAQNLDGTYYPYDPIAIVHDPALLWKEVRAETIQFETTKIRDLNNELEFDCNENDCDYTVLLDGLFPTEHKFVNGQGITVYNATIGDHLFHYTTTVKNLDREISKVTGYTDAQGVDYFPQYESYPYPLLKDVQEYTFDDRQAVAMHYFGNYRDGIIYTEERSKINGFYNVGVMYDIPDPNYIIQNFTFSDGINTSDNLALESYNETAMFVQEGYGKLYFDWPINDIVSPYGFNMYNNVTSYTTLYSKDFAAKDTLLNQYELRYPETAFTKDIIIKSINQNGTIINDKIEFDIIQYKNKSEYLNVYLYNKVLHDTENKMFAEIVSDDTNQMNHTITGFGMINGTIAKTMVPFDNYDSYVGDSIKKWDATLVDNIIYEKQGDDLLYRSPSDVTLSHLTPHTFRITINDSITREFDMRYYEFGGAQNMTINIQDDNKLTVKREIGFTTIQKPINFGYIDSLSVNDTPINQNCDNGCVLFLLPLGELEIVAENVWGGKAYATVPKEPELVIKESKEPDYTFMITMAFFALIGYMIYKRFIKGRI